VKRGGEEKTGKNGETNWTWWEGRNGTLRGEESKGEAKERKGREKERAYISPTAKISVKKNDYQFHSAPF